MAVRVFENGRPIMIQLKLIRRESPDILESAKIPKDLKQR